MGEATEQVLARAFQLIEEDRLGEAEALLEDVLKDEPYNADAWWVYAHAVQDPKMAQEALQRVLETNPEYPGAAELLESLEEEYPEFQPTVTQTEVRRVTPPPTLPDLPEDTDDFVSFDEDIFPEEEPVTTTYPITEDEREPQRRNLVWILVPILAVLAIIVVALILLRLPGNTTSSPTQVAAATVTTSSQQVAPPATEVGGMATEEMATAEVQTVSGEIEQAIENAFADFDVVDNGIEVTNTTLGNTLLVSICTSADINERSTTLNQAMFALSEAGSTMADDIEALGVRLVNCTSGSVLNVVATPVSDAVAFVEGNTDEKGYQAVWQPVL
ncbi:MAG: hypothetical protein K8L99_02705 [Anaerolineae bacterium]|nr:hypothetical protein [Anaerolineae bacterium]